MAAVGSLAANLKINLRMRTPLLGFRCWLAARIISIAALILGGRLIVDLEPEIAMSQGGKAYGTVRL